MGRNCSRQNKGISGNLTEGTAELCTREKKLIKIGIIYLYHIYHMGRWTKDKRGNQRWFLSLLFLEGLLMNILTIDHYLLLPTLKLGSERQVSVGFDADRLSILNE